MDLSTTDQLHLLDVTVAAQRAMLRARHPGQVIDALELAVTRTGGTVTTSQGEGDEILHIDIGLGVRGPLLPCAEPDDPARARLEWLLPGLVEDATRAVQRLWRLDEQGDATLLDALTGALNPAATTRLIGRAVTGDVIVGWSLDIDRTVAATHGPARVEVALRDLAGFARSELDVDERLGRLHGTGMVAVLPHPTEGRGDDLRRRVTARWERRDGVARIALQAASITIAEAPLGALTALRGQLGLRTDDGEVRS
jgi:hypothetical protein